MSAPTAGQRIVVGGVLAVILGIALGLIAVFSASWMLFLAVYVGGAILVGLVVAGELPRRRP